MSIDNVRIPGVVLVAAFVAALLGTLAWTENKLQGKVDRTELQFMKEELADIKADIKLLIRRH